MRGGRAQKQFKDKHDENSAFARSGSSIPAPPPPSPLSPLPRPQPPLILSKLMTRSQNPDIDERRWFIKHKGIELELGCFEYKSLDV